MVTKIVIDLSVQAREVSSILETIIEKIKRNKSSFQVNYDLISLKISIIIPISISIEAITLSLILEEYE